MENLKTKIQFLVNLYKSRNLSQAEAYAKKILRENPNVVFLYNILGLILNDLHKIHKSFFVIVILKVTLSKVTTEQYFTVVPDSSYNRV